MLGAMNAVAEGKMGINCAASEFGVPPTTLKDRIAGRVVHCSKSGPKPYLTHEEELELVKFLINCSKMGYGKTRGEYLNIVEAIVEKKGLKEAGGHMITHGWWSRFSKQWPQLSLCKGDPFPHARAEVTNYEVFKSYFDLWGRHWTSMI